MTSLERVLCAARRGVPDSVPVAPFAGFCAARLAGVPLGRYVTDPQAIAAAQALLHERVGHDVLVTAADTYYIAEAFGLPVRHHPDALPTAQGAAIETPAAAARLRVPDPRRDGRMPVYLEALRLLARRFGDRVAIRGTGTGPFSIAAYLYGDQRFLTLLADIETGQADEGDERNILALLEITAEASARFLAAQIREGEHIVYLGDSLSSADMISPAMYRKYAQPFQKRVFDAVAPLARAAGACTLLHVCGDNTRILEDLADTGCDILELDQKMSLRDCKARVGRRVALMGNLDPVRVVLRGSPQDVRRESLSAIADAGRGGGYLLGTGCFVPWDAPVANLRAMVEAARGSPEQADRL